jgi:hypothetical protein
VVLEGRVSRDRVFLLASDPSVGAGGSIDGREFEARYDKEATERHFIDQALLSASSSSLGTFSIPPPSDTYQELKARLDYDEAARLQREATVGKTQDLPTSVRAARNEIDAAVLEINMLMELTSTIQNERHLCLQTSTALKQQDAGFPLPLVQRLCILREGYGAATTRLDKGLSALQKKVEKRQRSANQLASLSKRWRVTHGGPNTSSALALDCSFARAPRRLPLHIDAQGQLSIPSSGTENLCTLIWELVSSTSSTGNGGDVLASLSLHSLMHCIHGITDSTTSSAIEESCVLVREDSVSRLILSYVQEEVSSAGTAIPRTISPPASLGASAAAPRPLLCLAGRARAGLRLRCLRSDAVEMELSDTLCLRLRLSPASGISSDGSMPPPNDLLGVVLHKIALHTYSKLVHIQRNSQEAFTSSSSTAASGGSRKDLLYNALEVFSKCRRELLLAHSIDDMHHLFPFRRLSEDRYELSLWNIGGTTSSSSSSGASSNSTVRVYVCEDGLAEVSWGDGMAVRVYNSEDLTAAVRTAVESIFSM